MTSARTQPARSPAPLVVEATAREGALSGALAAAAALVTSELIGLALPGRPSLLQGVGDRVIGATPSGLREWLISLVGTADKPLLLLGVTLVLLGGAAVLGVVARDRPSTFRIGVIVVAVLATAMALSIGAGTQTLLGTAVIAGVGAFVGQWVYSRLVASASHPYADPLMPTRDRKKNSMDRRTFLVTASWTAGAVALGSGAVVVVRRALDNTVQVARAALTIPTARVADPAVPLSANVTGIAPAVTNNADFYRIDTALYLPQVDVGDWSLTLTGRVAKPISLSYQQLAAMPQVNRVVTLTCVSNDVGGDLVGNARWQGVPLKDLLDLAGGATTGAEQVVGESVDGFTAGFPLALALDGREPFVALFMNGEPLPIEHGFPARLVVPGLYGYVSATKWLSTIRLTSFAEDVPFWVQRGWLSDGRIQSASRIDRPGDGGQVTAGTYVVAGRAWHQHVGVAAVQVQVDDHPWQTATLADAMGMNAWRLWSWQWQATPGQHILRVRMIDSEGNTQTSTEHPTFPGASSGWHSITVQVS